MLERLGEVLRKATDKIANAIFLDKNLLDGIVRDLQRALLEADVNVLLVKQLTDKIRQAGLDERVKGVDKKEHLIKILHDELLALLGESKKLKLQAGQDRIIFLGLYGAGKTTTIAKIGNYFAKRGNKVALVGLDVHRPAAKEQLKQLAEKNKLDYFVDFNEKNALKTWKKFKPDLKDYKVILVDTAGRHSLDKDLVEEISVLNKEINPTESILVMPADIGQAAKKQSEEFRNILSITGVIITRMDSTAKGGGALTACAETKAPVYFITTGEKINDIEEFDPKSFLSRLLGMGDLQSLIEKIKSVTDKDKQDKMKKQLEEGRLTLDDVIEQVKSMSSLGGFEKIKSMIPGLGNAKISDDLLENQQAKVEKWEHILKSMTSEEKENPELLERETSRISRVAKGAGVTTTEIRSLLKQYDMLNEMLKSSSSMAGNMDSSGMLSQKQMMKLAKKFGKFKKMRF